MCEAYGEGLCWRRSGVGFDCTCVIGTFVLSGLGGRSCYLMGGLRASA